MSCRNAKNTAKPASLPPGTPHSGTARVRRCERFWLRQKPRRRGNSLAPSMSNRPQVTRRRKRRTSNRCPSFSSSGASDEARTRYLHLGKVALYQMSYTRIDKGYNSTPPSFCQGIFWGFFDFFRDPAFSRFPAGRREAAPALCPRSGGSPPPAAGRCRGRG